MAAPVTNSISQTRLAELPVAAPQLGNLQNMPRLRAALLAGNTGMGPLDINGILNAALQDAHALVNAHGLSSGEGIYKDVYDPHFSGTAGATTSDKLARTQGSDLTKLNQLAYHGVQLGQGSSTLSGSGCLLASLTMSANDLRRTNHRDDLMNLQQANDLVRDNNGYAPGTSDMNLTRAANSMGLNVVRYRANRGVMDIASAQLQDKPDKTRLIVGVDYKPGSNSAISSADHYIAVKHVDDEGNLHATDPVGGRDIVFKKDTDGVFRSGKYSVAEVSVLTTADIPAPPRLISSR